MDCFDHNNSGSHAFIGCFETNLAQIQQASATYAVRCTRPTLTHPVSPYISAFSRSESHVRFSLTKTPALFLFLWRIGDTQPFSLCKCLKPACVCSSQAEFECVNTKKKEKKRGYKNSGVIIVKKCSVRFSVFPLSVNVSFN